MSRTQYHLVHGVVGVVALGVGAADPGRLQQLLLLPLLLPLLLLPVTLGQRLLGLSTPGGETASPPLRKGLLQVPGPGWGVVPLPAQTRRAPGPALLLLLPAAPLPVSARRSTEGSRRRSGPPTPPPPAQNRLNGTNLRGLFLCLSGDWDLLLSLWRYLALRTNTQLRKMPPAPVDRSQDVPLLTCFGLCSCAGGASGLCRTRTDGAPPRASSACPGSSPGPSCLQKTPLCACRCGRSSSACGRHGDSPSPATSFCPRPCRACTAPHA